MIYDQLLIFIFHFLSLLEAFKTIREREREREWVKDREKERERERQGGPYTHPHSSIYLSICLMWGRITNGIQDKMSGD